MLGIAGCPEDLIGPIRETVGTDTAGTDTAAMGSEIPNGDCPIDMFDPNDSRFKARLGQK